MNKRQRKYRIFSLLFLILISVYSTAGAFAFDKVDSHKIEKTQKGKKTKKTDEEASIKSYHQPAVTNATIDIQKGTIILQENSLVSIQEEFFEHDGTYNHISYLVNIFSSNIQVNAP